MGTSDESEIAASQNLERLIRCNRIASRSRTFSGKVEIAARIARLTKRLIDRSINP
jgi:hypothetical protein